MIGSNQQIEREYLQGQREAHREQASRVCPIERFTACEIPGGLRWTDWLTGRQWDQREERS